MREIKILDVYSVTVTDRRDDDENQMTGTILMTWAEGGRMYSNDYVYINRIDHQETIAYVMRAAANLIKIDGY